MVMNRNYKQISMAKMTLGYGHGKLMEFSPALNKWTYVQDVQPGSVVSIFINQGDGKLFKIIK
jgi:hypothetical protein